MFEAGFPDNFLSERVLANPGEVLLRRACKVPWVVYLESGRVALGLLEDTVSLTHQLGVVDVPAWLEPVDLGKDSPLKLWRVKK